MTGPAKVATAAVVGALWALVEAPEPTWGIIRSGATLCGSTVRDALLARGLIEVGRRGVAIQRENGWTFYHYPVTITEAGRKLAAEVL